jgi:hypothetical protein
LFMAAFRIVSGWIFAAAVGALLYRVNLHTDDAGVLAGLILIGSAMAAFILPRSWWPAAMIVGLSVIASEYFRSGSMLGGHIAGVAAFILFLSLAGIGAVTALRVVLQSGKKGGARA